MSDFQKTWVNFGNKKLLVKSSWIWLKFGLKLDWALLDEPLKSFFQNIKFFGKKYWISQVH